MARCLVTKKLTSDTHACTQNPNHATINQSNTQSLKTEIILARPIEMVLLR